MEFVFWEREREREATWKWFFFGFLRKTRDNYKLLSTRRLGSIIFWLLGGVKVATLVVPACTCI